MVTVALQANIQAIQNIEIVHWKCNWRKADGGVIESGIYFSFCR